MLVISSFRPWLAVTLVALFGLSMLEPGRAQMVEVVATTINGNPLDGGDLRFDFVGGERVSLNILLNTLNTDIHASVVTVSMRFPAHALTKIIRGPGGFGGTGWPVIDGVPMLSDGQDLPSSIWPHLGQSFFSVTSSADNPDCPCDEDNDPGMESLVHFLIVDLPGDRALPPGFYHVFQTDWLIQRDCSIEKVTLDITDGPKDGLVGLGVPVKSFVIDDLTDIVHDLENGLQHFDASIDINCDGPFRFIRGDVNVDGMFDQSDAVNLLVFLFFGWDILCVRAGDVNVSGAVDITDAIEILTAFFLTGTRRIPSPYPACGLGFSDASLDCKVVCSRD
jgi:hypothetical protein